MMRQKMVDLRKGRGDLKYGEDNRVKEAQKNFKDVNEVLKS